VAPPISSARLVAEQIKSGLGATVIVENKPGAGTTLGAEQVAKAEPDGYTLLMANPRPRLAINQDAVQEAALRPGEGYFAPDRAGGPRCAVCG